MYMDRMLEVGKVDNGYVIEVRVPFKKEKKKESKEMAEAAYPGSGEKKYVAKSSKAVGELISKLLPMLEEEFSSEDEFDKAFEDAAE